MTATQPDPARSNPESRVDYDDPETQALIHTPLRDLFRNPVAMARIIEIAEEEGLA